MIYTKCYYKDKTKEDEKKGHIAGTGDIRDAYRILVRIIRSDLFVDLGVDSRIILEHALKM
jgi:hypothetical protein